MNFVELVVGIISVFSCVNWGAARRNLRILSCRVYFRNQDFGKKCDLQCLLC